MIDDLYEPEVLKDLGVWRATDIGWTAIQHKLKDKYDIDAGPSAIKRAYNRFVAKTSEIIASDDAVKKALVKPILDIADQLEKINKITWSMLDNIDSNDQIKLSAIKEIRTQLDMQERILGRINQSIDPSKISKIEYTKISVNNLVELEKQGVITINRNNVSSDSIIDVTEKEESVDNS